MASSRCALKPQAIIQSTVRQICKEELHVGSKVTPQVTEMPTLEGPNAGGLPSLEGPNAGGLYSVLQFFMNVPRVQEEQWEDLTST